MNDTLCLIAIVVLCVAAYRAFRYVWALRQQVNELQERVEKMERRLQDVEHGR
jgi:hypothetical protein